MKINFYHTNDIHSNYDFLKKVHKYIRENKKENDFYLDGGDFLDISSLLVEGDKGKSAMDILMDSKLDCLTIGNNEIDLGRDCLERLLENNYPIISSNVYKLGLGKFDNLKRSMIIERGGYKFLILGVSPYFSNNLKYSSYNTFFNLNYVETTDPLPELKRELDYYKGKYDFSIFLSHSGHFVDKYLVDNLGEFDLVLGAHTHMIINEGNYSMSGRGERLGKVTVNIEDDKFEIIENIQIDLDEVENERFDNLYNSKLEYCTNLLKIKELPVLENLDFDPYKENRLINFLCDALYKHYDVDLAIMHNGISEDSLIKPVSLLTLHKNFPSKLNPTIFTATGKNLRIAIEKSFDENFIKQNGEGVGFRGTRLGTLGYSHNVSITLNPLEIKINGVDLKDNKVYKVVSDDYLQRGTYYDSLRTFDGISHDKYFIREFLALYFEDEEIYKNSKIKRIN